MEAAKKAFKTWRKVPVPQRSRILFKYHQLLVENWDDLAKLITLENGKNYTEAYGEVLRGIECVEFAAGAPTLMMGISCRISRRMWNQACTAIHRSSRWHYTIQFPDDGAVLDVPAGNCLRKYIHLKAIRADAVTGKSFGGAVS